MPSDRWGYGGAYLRHSIEGRRVQFADGSIVQHHDIFDPMPQFMASADMVFVDPPWNMGNLSAFYTKAGREDYRQFQDFYRRLFACIGEIAPKICYVEVGKEFLGEFLMEMKRLYRQVTFYNSTYYHRAENICYVIRGSAKRRRLPLEGIDEENIIAWICANEEFQCIGDLCMGRGLVGRYAHTNSRRFVGTELNHKRLAVLVEKLSEAGLAYELSPIERNNP